MRRNMHKICQQCRDVFEAASLTQKYCGTRCKKAYALAKDAEKIPNICKRCQCEYLIRRSSLKKSTVTSLCPSCINRDRSEAVKARPIPPAQDGRHNNIYRIKPPKVKIDAPCAKCVHGRANAQSDTGWECRANAMVCKPLAGKFLFARAR